MPPCVRIVSPDPPFAESIGRRIEGFGLSVAVEGDIERVTPSRVAEERVDVLLLDVRGQWDRMVRWLASMRRAAPSVEVILLNVERDVRVSMEAMRAGASSELPAPIDMAALRSALSAALARHDKRLEPRKPSLLERFERAMTAATFAQAGEFETAKDILEERQKRRPSTKKGRT